MYIVVKIKTFFFRNVQSKINYSKYHFLTLQSVITLKARKCAHFHGKILLLKYPHFILLTTKYV